MVFDSNIWPILMISLFVVSLKHIYVVESNSDSKNVYSDGLIFYSVGSGEKILPPKILPFKLEDNCGQNRWPRFGEPCSCANMDCGCCAGISMPQYNFNQKLCLNMSFDLQETAVKVFALLNDRNVMLQTFSARNPAPLCMPIMVPLPLAMCLKITDMRFDDYNMHMCMSMVVRMGQTNEMFEMRFNCVRMGQGGLQYLDPSGNPVFPQNGNGFQFFNRPPTNGSSAINTDKYSSNNNNNNNIVNIDSNKEQNSEFYDHVMLD